MINFQDWPLDGDHDDPKKPKGPPYAVNYPDCLAIVQEKVKPERAVNKDKRRREIWWQFTRPTLELYGAIAEFDQVLVHPLTSKHNNLSFYPPNIIFSYMTVVLNIKTWWEYTLIQSDLHWQWVLMYGNKLETRPQYTPTDCFETFPFPDHTDTLETIGETYYTHRQTIMQTRQEGLTKTYNHFHDPTCTVPDIQTLRYLHIQMDTAVAAAYGWHDLALDHDFHDTKQGLRFTISEAARREVLDRLLALNHHRYAEEVAQGLHDKKKGKGKPKTAKVKKTPPPTDTPTQGTLF